MPVSAVRGGRLPVYHYHRPPTTSIVQRRYVWGSKNLHKSGRSILYSCWSAFLYLCTATWFLTKTHLLCWEPRRLVIDAFRAHYKSTYSYLLTYLWATCRSCGLLLTFNDVILWGHGMFTVSKKKSKRKCFCHIFCKTSTILITFWL